MDRIPLYKVHMPRSIMKPLERTLFSGFVAEGPRTKEFEQKFGAWLGNKNTAMVNSCTSALTLALHESGVGPGTNVVSSPMTCVATNTPIKNLHADVKWADVEPTTGNLDPASAEEMIDEKTKAIMVVHWAGMPANLTEIHKIANKHGLPVIEDAAHALGARYKGKKIGTISDFSCFSFQAIKHITTIDGGALACSSRSAYQRTRKLRWFGFDRNAPRTSTRGFTHMEEAGYKMNMNDVQATFGLEQLKYLDGIVNKHKANAAYLRSELEGVVDLPVQAKGSDPSYWLLTVLLPANKRKKFSDYLNAKGIDNSTSHTRNDIYRALGKRVKYENLEYFGSSMLNLPCGWWVNSDGLDRIVKAVKGALA